MLVSGQQKMNHRTGLSISTRKLWCIIKTVQNNANQYQSDCVLQWIIEVKVISNTTMNKSLKKVLKELGLRTITPHGLRHTYASILLYKRVSL